MCLKVMFPVAQDLGSDDWLLAGQPREAVEYCVPATGAKVTLASAKQLIFHFCTRLPSDRLTVLQMHLHQALLVVQWRWALMCGLNPVITSCRYAALRPRFVTEPGFVCTVLLPNNSPVWICWCGACYVQGS